MWSGPSTLINKLCVQVQPVNSIIHTEVIGSLNINRDWRFLILQFCSVVDESLQTRLYFLCAAVNLLKSFMNCYQQNVESFSWQSQFHLFFHYFILFFILKRLNTPGFSMDSSVSCSRMLVASSLRGPATCTSLRLNPRMPGIIHVQWETWWPMLRCSALQLPWWCEGTVRLSRPLSAYFVHWADTNIHREGEQRR